MVDLPYWTVVNLLRGILSPVCRIEIRGTREVPAGPWILACNHLSHFDPPLIAGAFSRPIDFLAMRELFQPAWFGSLMRKCHVISVGRDDVDTAAFKTVLKRLHPGTDSVIPTTDRRAGHPRGSGGNETGGSAYKDLRRPGEAPHSPLCQRPVTAR